MKPGWTVGSRKAGAGDERASIPGSEQAGDAPDAAGSAPEERPGGAAGERAGEAGGAAAAESGAEGTRPPGNGSDLGAATDEKIAQYLDQLQRLRAEFDNYRKRTLRDKEQWWRQAKAELITELLPVVDDVARARAFAVDHAPEADGLMQILRKLVERLNQLGLEEMRTEPGTPFDPELHEAFMTAPSAEIEEGRILSTLEAGYRFDGEILRRSKVSVSLGSPSEGS